MNSLKNKVSNLVVVSRKDTSIYTTLNNQHISIINWVNKGQLKSFFDNKINRIEFNLNVDLVRIENILLKTKEYDEFLDVIDYLQVNLSEAKKNALKNDFSANKESACNYVLTFLKNMKNKLLEINTKAKQILKDKGTWNLYLTRYFLKGTTPYRKQIINAPIILYSVEIISENNKLVLVKKEEENELNEKLIVFLQRDIGKQKKTISDFENSPNVADHKKMLENVLERDILISSKGEMNFPLESSTEIGQSYNELYIEDRVCLGIYEPCGGKLKEDLEIILNSKTHLEIFNQNPLITIEQIHDAEITAEPILQIDKLDVYQRFAVRSSLSDNTIIQGPPGTGKSEVISNIIANLLYFQKDVMVVSEKVAALDVLKKRLKSLSVYMLSIYDNDKNVFYESICNLANQIGNSWINSKNLMSSKKDLTSDLLVNVNLMKAFKNDLLLFDEFINFKYENISFLDFIEELENFGGLEYFNILIEKRVHAKYDDFANAYGLDKAELFELVDMFCDYLKRYNIVTKNDYQSFFNDVSELKNFFDKYSINFDNDVSVEKIIKNNDELNSYLKDKLNYQKILSNNPFKFYDDAEAFKKIKKELAGFLNNDFFDSFNKHKEKVKAFLNVYDKAKKVHKKYIFDEFIKNLTIVSCKPKSKMFYGKKHSDNDFLILNGLKQLDNLNLEDYYDFDFIIANQEMFNPLAILYFFNHNIFEKKYLEFISKKLYLLDFDFFKIQTELNLDLEKYSKAKQLIELKNIFLNKFPQFVDNNLFQYIIKNYEKISWKNYDSIIAEIIRINLINRLSKLNQTDKVFIQKAIQVANSKRKQPIYKYIKEYNLSLKQLFPIWVSRPDQVSLFVPLRSEYFEYGIYDEASQMFLERAYPLLYRAKINIVAGDDKQLKPSSFFVSRDDEEETDDYEIDDLDVQDSLLDRAQTTSWNQIMLQNHYRSDYKELIEFSSIYIYDKKLNYASKNDFSNNNALEVINVNGYFDDRKNKAEAIETIKVLEKYVNKYNTILIITFNSQQANYINSMLMNNEIQNKMIIDKYLNNKLDVINIENVQGNEADLVILSISYGKKSHDAKVRNNFGPIIQNGGKNRLNVAITRAKSKMVVIKSIKAQDINETKNENLEVFKKFIAFLDSYQKINYAKQNFETTGFNNSFKDDVYKMLVKYLKETDLKLMNHFDIGNKKIDIAIMDKNYKKVLLGIMLNEWKINYGPLNFLIDIETQNFFEARGYKIFRINEHEWKANKKNVLENVFLQLKERLDNK